jgi:UDP-N-acetylmuramate--alanine ligase
MKKSKSKKTKKPKKVKKVKRAKKPEQPKVHFIGIGGIGVSSLAQYYLSENWLVSGSDMVRSEITDELKKKGAIVTIGHKRSNVKNPSMVVYSAAVGEDNPERKAAKRRKIQTLSYAQALGSLSKNYRTIAVAGSHGKSTTASMMALVLKKAGLDPTVILGTKLKEFKGNFKKGKSDLLVIEADEYNKSFHNYSPDVAIITNIDKEHLDTYKTYRGVVSGFVKFAKRVPKGGFVIANYKDPGLRTALKGIKGKVIWYNKHPFKRHDLKIPGLHNQENAEAVWRTAGVFRVKRTVAESAFKNYKGAWRRFEKLKSPGVAAELYTDYAHHPTEIRATLEAMREKYPNKKIICVFQPHQEDRFNRLFNEFKTAFSEADLTMLLPIYVVEGRRSEPEKTTKDLVEAIDKKNVLYINNVSEALFGLEMFSLERPAAIFMGAGDLDAQVRKQLGVK